MKAFGSFSLGYGIVAPGTARMTPEHPLNSKDATIKNTVTQELFYCVFRACGNIPALARPHEGGDAGPVKSNQEDKNMLHLFKSPVLCNAFRRDLSTWSHLQSNIVCLAMSRKSYPVGSSASVLRKASLIKRLALLRQTLFPTFLLAKKAFRFVESPFSL